MALAIGGSFAAMACAKRATDAELDAGAVEVVARWLIDQPDERDGHTTRQGHPTLFFLELPHGAEPSNTLLEHVESPEVRIRPRSASRVSGPLQVVDVDSGTVGTILTIGSSRLDPDGIVHVHVGRQCGSRCGSSGIVDLAKRGESWNVLHYEPRRVH